MLCVRVLGERSAVDDVTGEVLTRSARTIALVAYLALHQGTPQSRVRIAEAFWPDSAQQQSLTNLRRELHQLRRLPGADDAVVVTGTDLTWVGDPDVGVGVDLVEHLTTRDHALAHVTSDPTTLLAHGERALAAYGGDLLPGLSDEWVLAQRASLVDGARELCGALAVAAGAAQRWDLAVRAARRRVALDPLDETAHRDLMRLQAAQGDRAGALSTYHRCADVLEEQLGVAPDPVTRELRDTLVSRDQEPPSPEEPPPAAGTAAAPAPAGPAGLVGRDEERSWLGRALDDVERGGVRTVLVTGEPGVGKTRLVADLAHRAGADGACVAIAQCYAGLDPMPLAPVAQWLGEPTLQRWREALPSQWREEVDRLLPGGGGAAAGLDTRGVVDTWRRHHFFRGLSEALRPPGRAVVLVLENAQWCDLETLDLLGFLRSLEPRRPLLLLLTARSGDPTADRALDGWVRRARAVAPVRELELRPLGPAASADLLRRLCPGAGAEQARLLHNVTGGFPLHLVEAVRRDPELARLHAASPDLASLLRGRFDDLSPDCRAVVELASAVGRDFPLELLRASCDLSPEAVVRAVDELWRLRILTVHHERYDFSHDLLRQAAYEQLTPAARWLLHRRLAAGLEELHAGDPDPVADQLADQYARAGSAPRACELYQRAAVLADSVFAHADAARLHRRTLRLLADLPTGPGRDSRELQALSGLARALNASRGYSDPELAATLTRAVDLGERAGLVGATMDALVGLWAARFVQGDIPRAHTIALRALALSETPRGPDPTSDLLRSQAHFACGGSLLSLGRAADSLEHFDLASVLAADEASLSVGSHPTVHAHAWSAHAHWLLGDLTTARRHAAEAVERARALAHPYSLAIALGYAALTQQLLGDTDRLVACTDELATLSRRHGFAYYADWGEVLAGWSADSRAGTARMERAVERLRRAGAFTRMPYWLELLAQRSADPARAVALLDAATVSARTHQDVWWLPEVLRHRARLLPPAPAVAMLEQAAALAREHGSVTLLRRCRDELDTTRTLVERPDS